MIYPEDVGSIANKMIHYNISRLCVSPFRKGGMREI
ncbi:MAG: hypothetical protein SCARUB_03331 [Candidatus Scalindua rubra]|uniref:Uncharacterized protein n=1 Tax=Candidatus Scalindua rubra TaxID=1872076 RepID=A0A1E3X7E5_9BACT|nr:MAG: hypothetical protein SCARUB_03331 [Candidatus Scalindua rubra]